MGWIIKTIIVQTYNIYFTLHTESAVFYQMQIAQNAGERSGQLVAKRCCSKNTAMILHGCFEHSQIVVITHSLHTEHIDLSANTH